VHSGVAFILAMSAKLTLRKWEKEIFSMV